MVANASIIGVTAADDGSGAFVCTSWDFVRPDSMYISGDQHRVNGHVLGAVTTDTPEDPIIWVRNTVGNDMAFNWTDFHIEVTMDKVFSILATGAPTNWTTVVTAPALQLDGTYLGKIDYYQSTGSPIAIGDDGEFDYKLSFAGSIAYNQQMTPTPEPLTAVLLAGGALVTLLRRRRG